MLKRNRNDLDISAAMLSIALDPNPLLLVAARQVVNLLNILQHSLMIHLQILE